MMDDDSARRFQTESNRIEGITETSDAEVAALKHFVASESPTIKSVSNYVAIIQPGAVLRTRKGLNVRVGEHVAPPGGGDIRSELRWILNDALSGVHPIMSTSGMRPCTR